VCGHPLSSFLSSAFRALIRCIKSPAPARQQSQRCMKEIINTIIAFSSIRQAQRVCVRSSGPCSSVQTSCGVSPATCKYTTPTSEQTLTTPPHSKAPHNPRRLCIKNRTSCGKPREKERGKVVHDATAGLLPKLLPTSLSVLLCLVLLPFHPTRAFVTL